MNETENAAETKTVKPFSRAFYGTRNQRKIAAGAIPNTAKWCVPPVWLYVCYGWFCIAFTALYRSSQIVLSWFLVELWHRRDQHSYPHHLKSYLRQTTY